MPEPVLIGRNEAKLRQLAAMGEGIRYTTDLDGALNDPANTIYFDAQTTGRRADAVKKGHRARASTFICEKPTAVSTESAYELYEVARSALA